VFIRIQKFAPMNKTFMDSITDSPDAAFGRNHNFWTAAGSEAPRRFWRQPAVRKAVSPLRSSLRCASPRQAATAVQIFVVRARSCRIVLRMADN
jgi:hypothetical protein